MSVQSILAECGFKDADEVRRVAAANQLPPDRRPPECDLRGCRFVRLIKREEEADCRLKNEDLGLGAEPQSSILNPQSSIKKGAAA